MREHKAVNILRCLLSGQEVSTNGENTDRYIMSENDELCMIAEKRTPDGEVIEEVELPLYITLSNFIQWAEDFDDKNIAVLDMERTIQSFKKKIRKGSD